MILNSVSFIPLISLYSPGSVAFNAFGWSIRWYGILIAVSFLLTYYIAEHLVVKNNLNQAYFNDLIFFILVSGIVFARLYFVVLSWDYFKFHTNEIPKIWHGGQSIHGGIIGAVLAGLIYTKLKKISFYKYMDVIAVIAPLGQSIGRWGNFFNNEAFGLPCKNCLIKLFIPYEFRPDKFINEHFFQPTFFYESFMNMVIFVFLYKQYSQWTNKPGKIFWVYLLLYSLIRFFLEFLRIDSIYIFNLFPAPQIISIIIILISTFNLGFLNNMKDQKVNEAK